MRFSWSLLSLAFLAALVSAAPVNSTDRVARGLPGGGNSPEWKREARVVYERSCPSGSNCPEY